MYKDILKMIDWSVATGGITESMPRTTGPECINYLTAHRKLYESVIIILFCSLAMRWAIKNLEPIKISIPYNKLCRLSESLVGRKILLILMTFVFGMEIGFKLSTRTMLFAFNPCHITTILQIYLLAAKPNKTTAALFRIHVNYLNGPFLAFLFPDADSRHLPFEQTTYWIQHGLMFIIPIYLSRIGGVYDMESLFDFKWNIIGYTTMIIYHFTVLQFLTLLSNINLSYMLCASLSDPFQGPNYRLAACLHQAILCPILSKLFTIMFSNTNQIHLDVKIITNNSETIYNDYNDIYSENQINTNLIQPSSSLQSLQSSSSSSTKKMIPPTVTLSRVDDPIPTTKID